MSSKKCIFQVKEKLLQLGGGFVGISDTLGGRGGGRLGGGGGGGGFFFPLDGFPYCGIVYEK